MKKEKEIIDDKLYCGFEVKKLIQAERERILNEIVKRKIVCNDKKCDAPCCVSFRELKQSITKKDKSKPRG